VGTDIFAKIGDIKGESFDDKHKGQIEILSWSWGVDRAGTSPTGGGGGSGKAAFHDLAFTHKIDKASPFLLKGCATGEHMKEATITRRKAGKGQQEFLVIKLSDVVITSVRESDEGGATQLEQVTMSFAKVDLEYKAQKSDGSLEAGIHFKFDLKANKEG